MLRPAPSARRPSDRRSLAAWRTCWALVAAAVLVQIVYPLTSEAVRNPITVLSVLVFAAASVADAVRVHGRRGGAVLLVVAGGGGLVAETVGVHSGFPFGTYSYAATLGPQLFGVPLVVPLAWVMMAWPALVVGRTLGHRRLTVTVLGGAALAAWDVFLDPQMVDAGHWRWAAPDPGLPLVPGVPLTNYAGWVLVAVVVVGALHRLVPPAPRPSGPAATLYLWTYGSSVLGHVAFFDRPGSALVGGLIMGSIALPFAHTLLRLRRGRPIADTVRPGGGHDGAIRSARWGWATGSTRRDGSQPG
jgi:carotene biosynthesis associated membrane protein